MKLSDLPTHQYFAYVAGEAHSERVHMMQLARYQSLGPDHRRACVGLARLAHRRYVRTMTILSNLKAFA